MKNGPCLISLILFLQFVSALCKTYPSDLFGNFTEFDESNPTRCPKFITQTTFTEGIVPDSWKMPHNTIFHGHALCNSFSDERKTVYYDDSLVPDQVPPEVNFMLREHGPNIEVNYPLNDNAIRDGENYFIGYEEVTRFCQDGSKFNNGTLYFLFRPFLPVHMPLASRDLMFYPEWKYLVAVPRYSKDICLYRAVVPGAKSEEIAKLSAREEPEIMPSPIATPDELEFASTDTYTPVNYEIVSPTIIPEVETKASCFPGTAKVELRNGRLKLMEDLVVGDIVRTSSTTFSEIFMFTHRETLSVNHFIRLTTSKGYNLELSHGHYIYSRNELVPAKLLKLGDFVETEKGEDKISVIHQASARGLFNPQTIDGDIMVNGIKTSTYTTAIEPVSAHASLSFLRALYKWVGCSTYVKNNPLKFH